MGGGRFDPGAYRAFAASTAGKSTDEIYMMTVLPDRHPIPKASQTACVAFRIYLPVI